MSAPIINVPDVPILSTDTVTKRPTVVSGAGGEDVIAIDAHRLAAHRPALLPPGRGGPAGRGCLQGRQKLGWEPTVTFPELVEMMVEHDLKLEAEKAGL